MAQSIELIEGDITTAKVDAIVNAANPVMLGGGGVDGAIHRAAGPALLEACRKIKTIDGVRCPFGSARLTSAGNLPSKYVIHAVGPIYRNEADPALVLKNCYQSIVQLARENQCQSIACPAISCGAYGYPLREAAQIALQTCAEAQDLKVYFYLMGPGVYSSWQAVLKSLRRRIF